jgi:hypothetical protein
LSVAPLALAGDVVGDGNLPPESSNAPRHDAAATWTELAPPARAEHVGVLDEQRRRLVVFGGALGGPDRRDDVWALDLGGEARWQRWNPQGVAPSARLGAAAVYDRAGDRMIVIGGEDAIGRELNDVWELALSGHGRWRELHPLGSPPPGRCRHTATLDPEHGLVFVFGGFRDDGAAGFLGDLWQLSLGPVPAWTPILPSGPRPRARSAHVAVYAVGHRGILVYGGTGTLSLPPGYREIGLTDTWFLSTRGAPEWTDLSGRLGGVPPTGATEGAMAQWDTPDDRMIVIGGGDYVGFDCLPVPCPPGRLQNTPCVLSLRDSSWSPLVTSGIALPHLERSVAVIDPLVHSLIIHGGWSDPYGNDPPAASTWALSLDANPAWSMVFPRTPPPNLDRLEDVGPRTCVFDEPTRRLYRFSGAHVLECDLDGSRQWTIIETRGESPSPRSGAVVALDPKQERLIVHGGLAPNPPFSAFTDTWSLSLRGEHAWTRLETRGPAPGASHACAIVDPRRDELVLLQSDGGLEGSGVWKLSLSDLSWSMVLPNASWPARWQFADFASATLDPGRDEVVRFGGIEFGDEYVRDTWALSLAGTPTWAQISPDSYGGPLGGDKPAAVIDAARDRLLVIGGRQPPTVAAPPDGVWAHNLGGGHWSLLTTAGNSPLWDSPYVAFDTRHDRLTVLERDFAWELDLGSEKRDSSVTSAIAVSSPSALSVRAAPAGLGASERSLELSLSSATPAVLELFDLAGRRVWSRDVGALGAGRHEVEIPREAGPAPGLFFLRLTQSGHSATTKLLRLR